MIKKSLFSAIIVTSLIFSEGAFAVGCNGKVTHILDWETNGQCESLNEVGVMVPHLAYFHTSAGGGNKWVCSTSDTSDALIMMAYANQKSVTVVVPGSTCNTAHYTKATYIVMQP